MRRTHAPHCAFSVSRAKTKEYRKRRCTLKPYSLHMARESNRTSTQIQQTGMPMRSSSAHHSVSYTRHSIPIVTLYAKDIC